MRPRKRFGQHFLEDTSVLERISDAVAIRDDDAVLEIGPGRGALTDVLLASQPQIYRTIEIDRDLVPLLRARYAVGAPQFEVIEQDVLRADLLAMLDGHRQWRCVGNLPYNISSPLIIRLVEFVRAHGADALRDCHFMLQREMAQRLAAGPGSKAWGRISIAVQTTFDVELLFDIAPDSFNPPPRVYSSVVRLTPRRKDAGVANTELLDDVLRRAFAARRKRLSNALQQFDLDWDQLGIDPSQRPDNVSAEAFIAIANHLDGQSSE